MTVTFPFAEMGVGPANIDITRYPTIVIMLLSYYHRVLIMFSIQRYCIFLLLAVFVNPSTWAQRLQKRVSEQVAESSLVRFSYVNDYRQGTGKSSELFVLPLVEECAGTRVNRDWVLTTSACASRFESRFKDSANTDPTEQIADRDLLIKAFVPGQEQGIGYITPGSTFAYNVETNPLLAMIGLESPQGDASTTLPKPFRTTELDNAESFAVISFGLQGFGVKCGYTVMTAEPELDTFSRLNEPRTYINGEPVFINNGGNYQFAGIFDSTQIAGKYPGVLLFRVGEEALTSDWVNEVRKMSAPLQSATLPPQAPSFTPECSSEADSPLWLTAQGLAIMIGLPLATAVLSGSLGCICGRTCCPRKAGRIPVSSLRAGHSMQ